MNVVLVGKHVMDFSDKEGKQVQGCKLYMTGKDPQVQGLMTNEVWVGITHALYAFACSLDFSQGSIPAVLDYEVGLRGKAVLTGITPTYPTADKGNAKAV